MKRYSIQCNYKAHFIAEVEAEDEGEALNKAREMAEDADISDFTIGAEDEFQILRTNE